MKSRVVPKLAAMAAVLGMGLFVACGPGSSAGAGESGSPQPTSDSAGQGSFGIGASGQQGESAATVTPTGAAGQQSEPAGAATVSPTDAAGQQSELAGAAAISPTDAAGQQIDPVVTATITPIDDGQTQGAAPTNDLSLATATPVIVLPPGSSHEVVIDVTQYRQLLPRDAIAPVYDAQFISAESAALRPDELVIGVEINGESKAYPVGPLNYREMVNDTVGGVPVLVTW